MLAVSVAQHPLLVPQLRLWAALPRSARSVQYQASARPGSRQGSLQSVVEWRWVRPSLSPDQQWPPRVLGSFHIEWLDGWVREVRGPKFLSLKRERERRRAADLQGRAEAAFSARV